MKDNKFYEEFYCLLTVLATLAAAFQSPSLPLPFPILCLQINFVQTECMRTSSKNVNQIIFAAIKSNFWCWNKTETQFMLGKC